MMFALTPASVIVTLVGLLIFGFFLGLAFLKAPRWDRSDWPGRDCRRRRVRNQPSIL
jgi:hypothetical protein